jgi:hypothetical protein
LDDWSPPLVPLEFEFEFEPDVPEFAPGPAELD